MRRLIQSLGMLIFLLVSTSLYAVDNAALMEKGNKLYEQGEFEEAVLTYEKILATDMVSTALYYNLGCAYFSQKIYGKAILNFEKAHELSPRDADVIHNLEFTKLFLKDRFDLPEAMPFVALVKKVRSSLSLTELKTAESVLFSLLILSIIAYRLLRGAPGLKIIFQVTIILGVLVLIMGGWLLDRANALDQEHAVLLVKEANVSSAPIPGSSTLFVIHEGTTAEILDATDAWYELRLADGKTGWIVNEAVGIF